MDPVIINEKKDGDKPYMAFFKGRTIGFYASGLWPAKQIAVDYFNPSKKDAGLLSVELASEE